MQNRKLRRCLRSARTALSIGVALASLLVYSPQPGHTEEAFIRLAGHIPAVTANSVLLGRFREAQPISLTIALPMRRQAELQDLIRRVHDPKDALFGQYLTPAEFAERYGASRSDYDAVIAFAKSKGLTVTKQHGNRLLVDVSGTPAEIETAFGLRLNTYRQADGTTYFAPDTDPILPKSVADKVQGIVGLNSASRPENSAVLFQPKAAGFSPANATPVGTVGTGPMGYLSPQDIQSVYEINDGVFTGKGQTVGLFELGGFYPGDVSAYEAYFNLPKPALQAIPIGNTGAPGPNYAQVALDIDAVLASAPGISNILVYEAPAADGSVGGISPGWLSTLSTIAFSDQASEVGISYSAPESAWLQTDGIAFLVIQDYLFQEMAVQGQSVYAASGNSGAYADGETLSVASPASDPYVAAVGGTSLATAPDFFTPSQLDYIGESTWNDLASGGGASGGGVSSVFAIQPWQASFVTASNQGSTVARNLPDVSSVADPLTGFDVYLGKGPSGPGFYVFGGTGLASSLWVGFTAQVNQIRQQLGISPVGLAAPSLYGIYGTILGPYDFNDIADGSTNGNPAPTNGLAGYASGPGYDLTTGLGSYIGVNLVQDLSGYSSYYTPGKNMPPANPTSVQAVPGNGYVNLSWNKVAGATGYLVYRYPGVNPQFFSTIAAVRTLSYVDANVTDGTFYTYEVTAVGPGGQSDYTSTTVLSAVPNPVFQPLPTVVPAPGGKAIVTWQTNVLADTNLVYATNPALTSGKTIVNRTKAINHQVSLTGLKTGTVYYVAVSDNDGLTSATSPTVSFTAP